MQLGKREITKLPSSSTVKLLNSCQTTSKHSLIEDLLLTKWEILKEPSMITPLPSKSTQIMLSPTTIRASVLTGRETTMMQSRASPEQ